MKEIISRTPTPKHNKIRRPQFSAMDMFPQCLVTRPTPCENIKYLVPGYKLLCALLGEIEAWGVTLFAPYSLSLPLVLWFSSSATF